METDHCLWCGTQFQKLVGSPNRYCSVACKYAAEHEHLED